MRRINRNKTRNKIKFDERRKISVERFLIITSVSIFLFLWITSVFWFPRNPLRFSCHFHRPFSYTFAHSYSHSRFPIAIRILQCSNGCIHCVFTVHSLSRWSYSLLAFETLLWCYAFAYRLIFQYYMFFFPLS